MHERVEAPHIRIPHLTKRYHTAKRGELLALRNVSRDAARGGFFSIVGPSGCGGLRSASVLMLRSLGAMN